jgi:hypothetical protein
LRQFDVVVDCVEGRPFPVGKYTTTPTVPIVFKLSPGPQAFMSPPGPVIAPTDQSWLALCTAGVPKRHIVRAPFGCREAFPEPELVVGESPSMVAFVGTAQPLSRALRQLVRRGRPLAGAIFGPARGVGPDYEVSDMIPPASWPLNRFRGAWFAYCGEGFEWRALDFVGTGIPVICPDTPLGREFTSGGKAGFLHRPRDSADLARLIESLLNDETLRRRVGRHIPAQTTAATWDRSSSLVLAAIENLCLVGVDPPSPVPTA